MTETLSGQDVNEEFTEPHTYIHKYKCLNCSMHFAVYSWHEDWPNYEGGGLGKVFCPECGLDITVQPYTPLLHWVEPSALFIFEHIPGHFAQMK